MTDETKDSDPCSAGGSGVASDTKRRVANDAKRQIVTLRPEASEKLQTADWLAKLDRGNLTAEERAAFIRWLGEDPKNRESIKHVAAFWYGLNTPLSQLAVVSPRAAGISALSPSLLPTVFARLFRRFRLPATAVALAIIAVAAPVYYYDSLPEEETGYFATEVGESRVVSLSDGTEITLNTNSIIEQDFSEEERVVRLVSGEAIFDVVSDEERPFLVYAADGVIRAVGTRFSVRVDRSKVSVAVTDGRVALQRRLMANEGVQAETRFRSQSELPVVIDEGEAGEIDGETDATKQAVSERDLEERLSWTKGELVFYDKTLQSVVDEVARYTTIDIRIQNEDLKRRKITGILPIGGVDLMLDGIEGSLGVRVKRVSPNLVHLIVGGS